MNEKFVNWVAENNGITANQASYRLERLDEDSLGQLANAYDFNKKTEHISTLRRGGAMSKDMMMKKGAKMKGGCSAMAEDGMSVKAMGKKKSMYMKNGKPMMKGGKPMMKDGKPMMKNGKPMMAEEGMPMKKKKMKKGMMMKDGSMMKKRSMASGGYAKGMKKMGFGGQI